MHKDILQLKKDLRHCPLSGRQRSNDSGHFMLSVVTDGLLRGLSTLARFIEALPNGVEALLSNIGSVQYNKGRTMLVFTPMLSNRGAMLYNIARCFRGKYKITTIFK